MKKTGAIIALFFVFLSNAIFAGVPKLPRNNIVVSDTAHIKKIVKIPLPAVKVGTPAANNKAGILGPDGKPRKTSTFQDLKRTPPGHDTAKKTLKHTIGH
jgi:hypothetical protein